MRQTYQIAGDIIGAKIRPYLDPAMLGNVHNDIMRNKRHSKTEIDRIKPNMGQSNI